METINQILEKWQAHLEFKNGKVIFSSLLTNGHADTMEEAINAIVAADKKITSRFMLQKAERNTQNLNLESFSDFTVDVAMKNLFDDIKEKTDRLEESSNYKK